MKRVSISGPCFTILDGWRKQFAGEITLDQLTHNYHFEDRCHLAQLEAGRIPMLAPTPKDLIGTLAQNRKVDEEYDSNVWYLFT
jgi:hypothetical protein